MPHGDDSDPLHLSCQQPIHCQPGWWRSQSPRIVRGTAKNNLRYAATAGADYMITPNLALNASFNFLYVGTYVHVDALSTDTRLHVRAYIPGAGIAYRF